MTETVGRNASKRVRLTFDVPLELRREVRIEAARRDISLTEYLTELIARGRYAEREEATRK